MAGSLENRGKLRELIDKSQFANGTPSMLHPVRHSIRKSRLSAVTARDFFFPMYDV